MSQEQREHQNMSNPLSQNKLKEKQSKPMVYLVGAGPGDPGLITVRGKQLLERAEVIIYDYLASKNDFVRSDTMM